MFKSRSFTRGLDPDESRQRRININQQFRKERRDDELQLTRSYDYTDRPDSFEDFVIDVEMLEVNRESLIKDEWIKFLYSEADYEQLNATVRISRMIRKHPGTTAEIIKLELVPRFFEFLKNQKNTDLQQKAAVVLIELTANHCGCTFPAEASEIIGRVLETATDEDVLEATLLLLSNFAGQNGAFRKQFLMSPAWKIFLNCLTLIFNTKNFKFVSNGASALCNLCYRAKKSQNFDNILMCLPILVQMIHNDDYDLIFWGCRALVDIAEVLVQPVIDCGVSSRLIELLGSYTLNKIKIKAVRVIGLITKGSEAHTQLMIKGGVLSALHELLHSDNKEVLFRSCYAAAIVASGTNEQIQCIFDSGFVPTFLRLLNHNDFEVQFEAVWGITRCISCSRSSEAQINFLISCGVVEGLSGKLDSIDYKILHLVLRSLKVFLEFGKVECCVIMQRYGGEF